MKHISELAMALLAALSFTAGAEESGVTFYHKNWEVACDNTLTCRAAGYAKEEGTGGSVLLTRQAGANSASTGEVILAEADAGKKIAVQKLTLWINDKFAGDLVAAENETWRLQENQARALIDAVKGSGRVVFKGGEADFLLSNDGAFAALLKVDDVQGRIGTPGAWVKKGNRPEIGVAKAVPAPVIVAARVSGAGPRPLSEAEVERLRPQLLATLNDEMECDNLATPGQEDVNGGTTSDEITVRDLDDAHVLISTLCWRAAYNEGNGYWVTDKAMAAKPVAVTGSATDYSNGVISDVFLGRGMGDCASKEAWVWDGQTFRKSREMTTGICWYIRAGGAWDMPTWVTEVKPAL